MSKGAYSQEPEIEEPEGIDFSQEIQPVATADGIHAFVALETFDDRDANANGVLDIIDHIEQGQFPMRLDPNTDLDDVTYISWGNITMIGLCGRRFLVNRFAANEHLEDNFRVLCDYYTSVLTYCINKRRDKLSLMPVPEPFHAWDDWHSGGYDNAALKEDIRHLERMEVPDQMMLGTPNQDIEYIAIENMDSEWLLKQKDELLCAVNTAVTTRNYRRFASYYLRVIQHYWDCKDEEELWD